MVSSPENEGDSTLVNAPDDNSTPTTSPTDTPTAQSDIMETNNNNNHGQDSSTLPINTDNDAVDNVTKDIPKTSEQEGTNLNNTSTIQQEDTHHADSQEENVNNDNATSITSDNNDNDDANTTNNASNNQSNNTFNNSNDSSNVDTTSNTQSDTNTTSTSPTTRTFSSLRESMERKTKPIQSISNNYSSSNNNNNNTTTTASSSSSQPPIVTGDLNEYYRQLHLNKKKEREVQGQTFDMYAHYTKKESYKLQTSNELRTHSVDSSSSSTTAATTTTTTAAAAINNNKAKDLNIKSGNVAASKNFFEQQTHKQVPSQPIQPTQQQQEQEEEQEEQKPEEVQQEKQEQQGETNQTIPTSTFTSSETPPVEDTTENVELVQDKVEDTTKKNEDVIEEEEEMTGGTLNHHPNDTTDTTDTATTPTITCTPQLDNQETSEIKQEEESTPLSSSNVMMTIENSGTSSSNNHNYGEVTTSVNTIETIGTIGTIATIETSITKVDKASDAISDISNSSHGHTPNSMQALYELMNNATTGATNVGSIDVDTSAAIAGLNSGSAGGGGGAGGVAGSAGSGDTTTKEHDNELSTIVASGTTETEASDRIRLGICAMDKKAKSKPMAEILTRMDNDLFEVVMYGDEMILHKPIEEWPLCDALIAFYSNGYPLTKVEDYAELRKPFVLNNLRMQRELMDRRRVYDLLRSSGIDVPRHVYMNRDGYTSRYDEEGNGVLVEDSEGGEDNNEEDDDDCSEDFTVEEDFIEHDDHIEVNGVVIHKPFVEKPVDADDHNIAIYYPMSAGGGCKKLFRKVGDRSSEFYPEINEVRRDGSFIYESFLETQGTDVKMYTVGPDYGHAEARKSPTVDGRVERNKDGKEVRFPVILTLREKEIARRIVLVFKQQVCGFDLLRVQEGKDSLVSYVCDVNGWSFVKNSRKYYDDCAQILTEHMLAALKPWALVGFSALDPLMTTMKDAESETPSKGTRKRSRKQARTPSVFTRTRKMLKGVDDHNQIISAPSSPYRSREGSDTDSTNAAATLQEGAEPVRLLPDMLMHNPASISASSRYSGDDDTTPTTANRAPNTHQEELRCVIAVVRHGDRTPKQKLKFDISEHLLLQYFHDHTDNCRKDVKIKDKKPMTEFLETVKLMVEERENATEIKDVKEHKELLHKLHHMLDILKRWKIVGLNRKLQLKPKKWVEYRDENDMKVIRCSKVQLILKWGGNLTKLGEKQSITLGQRFRHQMYPDREGGGILRLHSTFRHDMKIKTSDEGRVMKTAAAFAKGLLELEGEIPPILVSLIYKEKDSLHMLDPSGNKEVSLELDTCKKKINENLQKDFDANEGNLQDVCDLPEIVPSLQKALQKVGNPRKMLFAIRETIGELINQLDELLGVTSSESENRIEGGEGLKGDEVDEALCGIKLYKGETLLELTERWRLLHKKLYDEESDTFDLSRCPDVHDNVRFDMLHNPHLPLTATLGKLYTYAKLMADVVVPQEYGTSVEEKRSIGNKNCHALLEKIKYDLIIARTDNQVDMRYLINMDYSADLPINTMGRRIRTRLYFTSESHLHTMLNVLRYPNPSDGGNGEKNKPILSQSGMDTVCSAPELCYLTQLVIRLFENTKKDPDDPKRFRIEILFSPGASNPPLHMSEKDRNNDSTRFDTEPLQSISKEGLTCQEVEEFFNLAIQEGGKSRNDNHLASDTSTVNDPKLAQEMMKEDELKKISKSKKTKLSRSSSKSSSSTKTEKSVMIAEEKNTEIEPDKAVKVPTSTPPCNEEKRDDNDDDEPKKEIDENKTINKMTKVLARQFFWTGVAVATAMLGIGCLIMSKNVSQDFNTRRRWSRR